MKNRVFIDNASLNQVEKILHGEAGEVLMNSAFKLHN